MLTNPALLLDATMSVSEVLTRAARAGYWLDPEHPVVRPVIAEKAELLGLPVDDVVWTLARNPSGVGAAIRRQWYGNVLWYPRVLYFVLIECEQANPDDSLRAALDLQETDSLPPVHMPVDGSEPHEEGVVFEGGRPVAVALDNWGAAPPGEILESIGPDDGGTSSRGGVPTGHVPDGGLESAGGEGTGESAVAREVRAWPRLEAPESVPAQERFTVIAGLGREQQAGVAGGEVVIDAPAHVDTVNVTVELIAEGFDAPDGWSRELTVPVDDPASAEAVAFELIGQAPTGEEAARLSMLQLRYVYDGAVCGIAARPIMVLEPAFASQPLPDHYGTPWRDEPAVASPVVVAPDPAPVDLEIELAKPDGNPATGRYVCRLYSPHGLSTPLGPFEVDLGNDAQTFARSLVNDIRSYSGHGIVDNLIRSAAHLLAGRLGAPVIEAIREVAGKVGPAAPSVLFVSEEPYVPWEITAVDPPLDPERPPVLGAQVRLGRWLRNQSSEVVYRGDASPSVETRPAVRPPATLNIGPMAVMAGYYNTNSGRRQLPLAQEEAKALIRAYRNNPAIPIEASLDGLMALLNAELKDLESQPVGGAALVHFAGHGEYDASSPDASVLILSDGQPLKSLLFRSARYGEQDQPLFFINACMVGLGDEILGDMGGFPGNCLAGGFGGVLGALWEVKDTVGRDVALEFWRRAIPTDGSQPEPVGEILRDLRSRYAVQAGTPPPVSYLAYVYYGHPGLTIR